MTDNLEAWNKLARPPAEALKPIRGKRFGGSNIDPQWRLKAMTEQYGPCGVGWKYTIEKLWLETGSKDQVCAFALVNLYVLDQSERRWCEPIPGIGGSMLIEQESRGLHTSDECYKMAVTDALSVAMKALGVAADIYLGQWDGSKYKDENELTQEERKERPTAILAEWLRHRHELDDKDKAHRIKMFSIWFKNITGTPFTPVLNSWTDQQIKDCEVELDKEAQARVSTRAETEPASSDRQQHQDPVIAGSGAAGEAGD